MMLLLLPAVLRLLHLTQANELEVALAERNQQMSQAEDRLKLKEMEYERRVTSLQKEHASRVATILDQATAVAPAATSQHAASQGIDECSRKAVLESHFHFSDLNEHHENSASAACFMSLM